LQTNVVTSTTPDETPSKKRIVKKKATGAKLEE
jgi:hypothetical protein